MIIIAQFLKRHGKPGTTKNLGLPERVISLPREYGDAELKKFFDACTGPERALFSIFLFTGFREQEAVHLFWSDINVKLNTIRVTLKPEFGFSPKRWEEREVPVPKPLIDILAAHPRRENCRFVFPSPAGNREWHMLDRCKEIATRAGLDEKKWDLKTFRSTYATRMAGASASFVGEQCEPVSGGLNERRVDVKAREQPSPFLKRLDGVGADGKVTCARHEEVARAAGRISHLRHVQ